MPEFWNQFENRRAGDGYVLGHCVHRGEHTAYYAAEKADPDPRRAIVRLVKGEEAGARFELWLQAAALSQPNLLRVLDAGWLESDGHRMAWAALEHPDENLADVLRERALESDEARFALLAVCDALAYIHERGMVHGAVAPWSIVAVGDNIKLTSDGLEAPRVDYSASGDVWALGMTACEMLTRRRPEIVEDKPDFTSEEAQVVEPFREFISRCLHADPSKRWSAARLAASLRDPRAAMEEDEIPAPVAAPAPVPVPAQVVEIPVKAATRPVAIPRWGYVAAGAVVACGALLMGTRHSSSKPTASNPPAAQAVAAAPQPPLPVTEKKPAEDAGPVDAARAWRVVAYTYHSARHAEKKADTINLKHPELKAEVFAPRARHAPYLVSLGGRMTRDEAVALQREARSKGMPRDTFVRNYSR